MLPVFFAFIFVACSSTSHLNIAENNIASKKKLDVPFFPQKQYYCGPAALASILNYHQVDISPEELANQIFIPEKKGSLQLEVIAASRRAHMLPYPIKGKFEELLIEVNAGNPVLVLQNLGFSWMPKWHYALVIGYDLNTKTLILHSGRHKDYQLSFRTFLSTWQRANNWGLVVVPINIMPASAEQDVYVRAVTHLESTGHQQTAFQGYEQALMKWPNNEIALLGLGNYYYDQQEFRMSAEILFQLVKAHKENPAGWNNFAFALQENHCHVLAEQAIEKAIHLAEDKRPFLDSKIELKKMFRYQGEISQFCNNIKF